MKESSSYCTHRLLISKKIKLTSLFTHIESDLPQICYQFSLGMINAAAKI